jgi:hypothetical protein
MKDERMGHGDSSDSGSVMKDNTDDEDEGALTEMSAKDEEKWSQMMPKHREHPEAPGEEEYDSLEVSQNEELSDEEEEQEGSRREEGEDDEEDDDDDDEDEDSRYHGADRAGTNTTEESHSSDFFDDTHSSDSENAREKSKMQLARQKASHNTHESRKIWHSVYADEEGFTNICEQRFEVRTASQYLSIEDNGRTVRNIEYGAGCARTTQPMLPNEWPMFHYIEMQIFGGGAPDPSFTGVEYKGKWIPYGQDGMHCVSVGIVAADSTANFEDCTVPDDSFMWCRAGHARWPFSDIGDDSRLAGLRPQELSKELVISSADRIGIIVDMHMMKLGFTKNGYLVPRLTRDLQKAMPAEGLRFVVGGVRPDTRFVLVSRDQAVATLMNIDWVEWTRSTLPELHFSKEATVRFLVLVVSRMLRVRLFVHIHVELLVLSPPLRCIQQHAQGRTNRQTS